MRIFPSRGLSRRYKSPYRHRIPLNSEVISLSSSLATLTLLKKPTTQGKPMKAAKCQADWASKTLSRTQFQRTQRKCYLSTQILSSLSTSLSRSTTKTIKFRLGCPISIKRLSRSIATLLRLAPGSSQPTKEVGVHAWLYDFKTIIIGQLAFSLPGIWQGARTSPYRLSWKYSPS